MAEALTLVAEEMGRVLGMVWSGVGVAVRLNNQVMTTVLRVTSRIVQLLLLLTHKAADLLSILLADLLLFLGDIGNAVMAMAAAVKTAATLVLAFINGVFVSIMSAAVYSCQLVYACYLAIISAIVAALGQLGSIVTALKHAFILFGSSIVFILSFVPNMVHLMFSGLIHLFSSAYLSCSQAMKDTWLSVSSLTSVCSTGVINFFSDIPLEAVLGVGTGLALLVGLRYILSYMMDNMILIPDLPSPTFLVVLRQRLIRWYMGLVQGARQPPPPIEPDTEEEDLDDANDENGNDNNDNVPDLNLPQNQHFRLPQVNQHPFLPQVNQPLFLPQVNQPQDLPQVNQPLIPLPQARRPLTRQRMREGAKEHVAAQVAENRLGEHAHLLLYQELEQEREERLCVVCQDRVKCIILLPCRHLCLCVPCSAAIIGRGGSCPVCRKDIIETMKVFL